MTRLARPILLVFFVAGAWASAQGRLPWASVELPPVTSGGVEIVDRHGDLLYEFADARGGSQSPLPLDEISPYLVQATIATEDADFYRNPGINLRGLGRAIFENLAFWEYGGLLRGSGGSSITQQVVKSLRLVGDPGDRDPVRKLREIFVALALARTHNKEEILEFYLNTLFYGGGAYGAEAAAQRYFGKPAIELTLGEAAFLAGIPNAPAVFDAVNAYERVRWRQEEILNLMVRHGFISPDEAALSLEDPIELRMEPLPMHAPHFVMYVRELLPRLVGEAAVRSGVRVTTTLDVALQRDAEEVLEDHLKSIEGRLGGVEGAVVAIDPRSGELLAMVGGRFFDDPESGQVNNALALNQPGSAFKPITYLAAFQKGWSPATIVADQPVQLNDGRRPYVVQNFDGRYSGRLSVRQALGNSLNPPAVQALLFAGLPDVHQLGARMGLSTLEDVRSYGPAFTLGAADVTLLDLTFVYAVLANGGEQRGMPTVATSPAVRRPLDPAPILRIEDSLGRVLWQHQPEGERIASAAHAYLITHILSDDSARTRTYGRNSLLNLPSRPAAAKTGLSDGPRDAWTIGYTPQLVVGVWVGDKENRPMPGASSVRVASPIWQRFMLRALADEPAMAFAVPDGLAQVQVCRSTGLPAGRGCSQVATELLAVGQAAAPVAMAPPAAVPQPPPEIAPPPVVVSPPWAAARPSRDDDDDDRPGRAKKGGRGGDDRKRGRR